MTTLSALLVQARREGQAIGETNPTGHYPGLTAAAVLCLCTVLPEWRYKDLLVAWLNRRRIRAAFRGGWQEAVAAYRMAHPHRATIHVLYRQAVGE